MAGTIMRPRPVPGRLWPAVAGFAVLLVAVPVFLVGGFPLRGWALAAVLWAAGEAIGFWLSRIPTGADQLTRSGFVGVATAFRGIGVLIVLAAVTVANKEVGVAALLLYLLAYTFSLGISLVEYFTGPEPQ